MSTTPDNFDGQTFTLQVTFTAPQGFTGSNQVTLIYTITSLGMSGGVLFEPNPFRVPFSFNDSNCEPDPTGGIPGQQTTCGTGSFLFFIHDVAIDPGQTVAITGTIAEAETTDTGTHNHVAPGFSHGLRISSMVSRSRKLGDIRAVQFYQTGIVQFDETKLVMFSRIDGNHRLAATTEAKVRERTMPFCIIFCRNTTEFRRVSRALFHIINLMLPMNARTGERPMSSS